MTFKPAIARILCQASADAYKVHDSGANLVLRASDTDTVATITHVADGDGVGPGPSVIVAFRGTTDLRNWLTDLDARMLPWDQAQELPVHRGFLEAWLSIREDVIYALRDIPLTKVWFTGHSLGGALAMLASYDLRYGPNVSAGLYTFGQPRVGGRQFAKLYNLLLRDRAWRVVHREDLVPHVPWLLGRYAHAGAEAWYERNDPHSVMIDRTFAQYAVADLSAAADVLLRDSRDIGRWIGDHEISNYLALFPKCHDLFPPEAPCNAGPIPESSAPEAEKGMKA